MSRSNKPEFNEMGITRLVRRLGFFLWIPAMGLSLINLLILFPVGTQQLLPVPDLIFPICFAVSVPFAIYLVNRSQRILRDEHLGEGRATYWFISILSYFVPGVWLTGLASFILVRDLNTYGGALPYPAWFFLLLTVMLILGPTCIVVSYLSAAALRQHLATRANAQPQEETKT